MSERTYVYATTPNPVGDQPLRITDHPIDEPGLFLVRVYEGDAERFKEALRNKGDES